MPTTVALLAFSSHPRAASHSVEWIRCHSLPKRATNTTTTMIAITPPSESLNVPSLLDPAPASPSTLPSELAVPAPLLQSLVQGSSVAKGNAELVVDDIVQDSKWSMLSRKKVDPVSISLGVRMAVQSSNPWARNRSEDDKGHHHSSKGRRAHYLETCLFQIPIDHHERLIQNLSHTYRHCRLHHCFRCELFDRALGTWLHPSATSAPKELLLDIQLFEFGSLRTISLLLV